MKLLLAVITAVIGYLGSLMLAAALLAWLVPERLVLQAWLAVAAAVVLALPAGYAAACLRPPSWSVSALLAWLLAMVGWGGLIWLPTQHLAWWHLIVVILAATVAWAVGVLGCLARHWKNPH